MAVPDDQEKGRGDETAMFYIRTTCSDAGAYTVVVSNDLGSVTTLPGILTVPDCR